MSLLVVLSAQQRWSNLFAHLGYPSKEAPYLSLLSAWACLFQDHQIKARVGLERRIEWKTQKMIVTIYRQESIAVNTLTAILRYKAVQDKSSERTVMKQTTLSLPEWLSLRMTRLKSTIRSWPHKTMMMIVVASHKPFLKEKEAKLIPRRKVSSKIYFL